jgi:hypothetical protein
VTVITSSAANLPNHFTKNFIYRGEKMLNSITLIAALATLGCFSVAGAEPVTSTAVLKDVQCRQSACTTKCDAKGEKCLINCNDKQTGNSDCKKSFYRVSPFGVLEVARKQRAP